MRLNLPYFTRGSDADVIRLRDELLSDSVWLDTLWARLGSRAAALDFDEHHTFTVQPEPGNDEYTLLDLDRPGRFWAFLDLSSARQGDEFIIRLYVKLALPGCEFELHESYALQDQLAEPVVSLVDRFVPASRLTLSQSRGLSKKIPVEFFVQYAAQEV